MAALTADPDVAYDSARERLRERPLRWLVTGSAGFIGSHLLEELLRLGQHVVSLDNFATGFRRNLDEVQTAVGRDAWRRHTFIEASITDLDACRRIVENNLEKRLQKGDGRPNFNVSFYALDRAGRYGSAAIWSGATFAVADEKGPRKEDSAALFEREG